MLYKINFFIFVYKIVKKILQFNEHANNNLRMILNSQMRLILKTNIDKKRFNFFINNEMIAIIFEKYDVFCERDIILTKRCDDVKRFNLRRINQNNAAYMFFHYVFFFHTNSKIFIEF